MSSGHRDPPSGNDVVIDTTPTCPKPAANLIELASQDIPLILANVPQGSNAAIELVASDLVQRLKDAGHTLLAAFWAIHEAVQSGRLQAGLIEVELPSFGKKVGGTMRHWGGRDDRHIEWKGGGKTTVPVPEGKSAPFEKFKVAATDSLWARWRTSVPTAGNEAGAKDNEMADNPFNERAFQSSIINDAVAKILQARDVRQFKQLGQLKYAQAVKAVIDELAERAIDFERKHAEYVLKAANKGQPLSGRPFSEDRETRIVDALRTGGEKLSYGEDAVSRLKQAFSEGRADFELGVGDRNSGDGSNGKRNTAPIRKRGRPPDTDPKADKRIAEAWQTGQYKTLNSLAMELKTSKRKVKLALDRHRHRKRRNKRSPK